MPKKGYRQSEEHKQAVAQAKKEYWKNLREEWQSANDALAAMGSPRATFSEFLNMWTPSGKFDEKQKPREKRKLSEEHKRKLSERAKELHYSDRIKPYMGQGKKELSFAEKQVKKEKQKMKRYIASSKKRSAMRLARECMVGAQGEAIREQIRQEIGSLNVRNKDVVLEVVDFLIELGFLEPFSKMSTETRRKMSQSARLRHIKRKDRITVLQERAKKRIEEHLASERKKRESKV